jgi:hypothetical protein
VNPFTNVGIDMMRNTDLANAAKARMRINFIDTLNTRYRRGDSLEYEKKISEKV